MTRQQEEAKFYINSAQFVLGMADHTPEQHQHAVNILRKYIKHLPYGLRLEAPRIESIDVRRLTECGNSD